MNIAIIISQPFEPNAGGVQRVTASLHDLFKKNGNHVIIISMASRNINDKKYLLYNVKNEDYLSVGEILESNNINVCINQKGYSVDVIKKIKKHISNDILIINCLHINPLSFYSNHRSIISKYMQERKLSLIDNAVLHYIILMYHIIKQRIELAYIIKNSDAFVMLSERFKSELYHLVPSVKKYDHKIYGINNPFERPEINIDKLEKDNVILHVGRLEINQKRVDLLLQIWKKLHVIIPDWKFWVVGYGKEEKYMKKFCNDNNLDRVVFMGRQNPEEYYKKAKIFHLTSAFEGFGNVLVEAQSYGCVPVLFDSYPAASEIVNHQKDGLLIKPFNVDKYVENNMRIIQNPIKLKEMSNNAYDNVIRFSYQNTYKKWLIVFKEIFNKTDEVN